MYALVQREALMRMLDSPTMEAAEGRALRVGVVTNVIPHYRKAFYERLFQRPGLSVIVYCQPEIPGSDLHLAHSQFQDKVRLLKSWGLKNERLVWQVLPVRELLRGYDVLFLYGNPRILSTVFLSLLLRMRRVPLVVWGQAHTFRGHSIAEKVRLAWWRLFGYALVYTDAEVGWLSARGYRGMAVGMNNGLDQTILRQAAGNWPAERLAAWRHDRGLSDDTVIMLSCARLIERNEFGLVIEALPLLKPHALKVLWAVVGAGNDAARLARRAADLGVQNRIRWVGACYEEDELAPWFLSAKVLVHPGPIGLTLLHAFGYGLPVITHRDASAHGPEFAAMSDGSTGATFARGSARALAGAVLRVLGNEAQRQTMAREALRRAERQYNVDIMVARFESIARSASAGVEHD